MRQRRLGVEKQRVCTHSRSQSAASPPGAALPPVKLRPGTSLLRAWGGRTHTVLVRENGFEHEGRRYASLTEVARAITGAHWSGPRFFGLRKLRPSAGSSAGG